MKRTTFLSLTAVSLAALPLPSPALGSGTREVVAAQRVRSVARGDRSTLIGASGACASRRARSPFGGYTLADVV